MENAPIALFAYNRPDHLRMTVEALKNNTLAATSNLHIFSDGQKTSDVTQKVAEVRDYIKTITGFNKVFVYEQENNKGLANSIIDGVTKVINEYGRIIVLEDDMVTSPYFLKYMNDALEFYKNDTEVISIHGYLYPLKKNLPETFFLYGADCWGWGTWSKGWQLFNPDGRALLLTLKKQRLLKRFDFNNSYPYKKMLQDQIEGKNDSWAIRWYASALAHKKLTLYPGRSLVKNIGLDNSGTHCDTSEVYETTLTEYPILIEKIPKREDAQTLLAMHKYFLSFSPPFFNRIRQKLTKKKS